MSKKRAWFKDKSPKIPGQVFPIDKKPHQRSKKPLRRVEIREVDGKGVEVKKEAKGGGGDFMIRESSSAKKVVPEEKPKSTRIKIEEVSSQDQEIQIQQPADFLMRESKSTPVPSQPKKTKVGIFLLDKIAKNSFTKKCQKLI